MMQQYEIRAGIYRHYKGGYYQVLGIGQHTETHERLVIYISLSMQPGPRIRVRPIEGPEGFLTHVGITGNITPRFEYIGSEV